MCDRFISDSHQTLRPNASHFYALPLESSYDLFLSVEFTIDPAFIHSSRPIPDGPTLPAQAYLGIISPLSKTQHAIHVSQSIFLSTYGQSIVHLALFSCGLLFELARRPLRVHGWRLRLDR
jgi:hypothetical protein